MQLTSGGLSGLARGAGLPLVGVGRAVELRRAHVEEQRHLEVVHHGQAVAVSEHHPGTQGGSGDVISPGLRSLFVRSRCGVAGLKLTVRRRS